MNTAPTVRMGRAPVTSTAELSHIGLRLFVERGFDAVTVDDIALAAGISRRTFFRYFPSKNDLPWGDFDRLIDSMREHLAALPDDVPLLAGLKDAVIEFNAFPEQEVAWHRQRMTLLLTVPTLAAHSTLRYARWRAAVAEHVAARLGAAPRDLLPQTIAWTFLAVSIAAYERWLAVDDAPLRDLLAEAFDLLGDAFPPAAA